MPINFGNILWWHRLSKLHLQFSYFMNIPICQNYECTNNHDHDHYRYWTLMNFNIHVIHVILLSYCY